MSRRSFTQREAAATIEKLIDFLGSFDLEVPVGSGLERAYLAAANWGYQAQTPTGDASDGRQSMRDIVGAVNLAANLLSVVDSPQFEQLVAHLPLVASADPSTRPTSRFSTPDCKLFELIVGSWAIRAGADRCLSRPMTLDAIQIPT